MAPRVRRSCSELLFSCVCVLLTAAIVVFCGSNQFATKAYYDEMFDTIINTVERLTVPMEWTMVPKYTVENCSWWAPHLYGHQGEDDGAYIGHVDGRLSA
jgi:hypothetical protein